MSSPGQLAIQCRYCRMVAQLIIFKCKKPSMQRISATVVLDLVGDCDERSVHNEVPMAPSSASVQIQDPEEPLSVPLPWRRSWPTAEPYGSDSRYGVRRGSIVDHLFEIQPSDAIRLLEFWRGHWKGNEW